MTNKIKLPLIVIALAGVSLVVLACVKELATPLANQNTNASNAANEVDTSNWKTYRNEALGIQFLYPADWILKEYKNQEKVYPTVSLINHPIEPYGTDGDIKVDISADSSAASVEDWFQKEAPFNEVKLQGTIDFMNKEMGAGYLSNDDIVINESEYSRRDVRGFIRYVKFLKPAYVEGPAYTHKIYNFKVSGKIYTLSGSAPTGQYSEKLLRTFDGIVSTVEFF